MCKTGQTVSINISGKKVADVVVGFKPSLEQALYGLLSVLEFSKEVRAINVDDGSAPAGELLVRLEPSDRLRRILAAIAAGDVDALVVEHKGLVGE